MAGTSASSLASTSRFVLPSIPALRLSRPSSVPRLNPRFPRFSGLRARHRLSRSERDPHGDRSDGEDASFERAVALFNGGDYYTCHDVLEELWYTAEEPSRTLLHGLLQCAVGLHHLFNQNHRGAMMELGEGLCKLRKMRFDEGPFIEFELEVSAVLEFLYHTQMELAACSDDICLTMDGSQKSYQLLGSFAAGQHIYNLDFGPDGIPYILFSPSHQYTTGKPPRVKIPMLLATEAHLKACS